MVRRVKESIRAKCQRQFRSLIRELRQQLADIKQKIDHLIKHYRKYYITSNFSHSRNHEFKD